MKFNEKLVLNSYLLSRFGVDNFHRNLAKGDWFSGLLFNGKIMTPTSLYEATIFSSGGMTKILKKLEDKKLISRISSKKDKRSKLVKIEPQGEKLVGDCFVDIIRSDNKIFSVLDKKEQKSLKQILKKLIYSLVEN